MDTSQGKVLVNKQYGKWNAILATQGEARYVFYQNQSKMFPEQLEDWTEAIKALYLHNAYLPVRLDIDITNHCPHNCEMCFAKDLRKNKAVIPLSALKDIFNNFKKLGGKSVRLTGGGEPLAHPDIVAVIEYLGSLGLKITIETNGDLLSPTLVEVIAKHVHHLRISVDAADNESRGKVHRPSANEHTYDALVGKIKAVRKEAQKFNRGDELFLGATFVVVPENYLVAGKFVTDMRDIGVNWVALRKNIYRKIYEDHPEILPFIEREVAALRDKLCTGDQHFTIEEQYGVSFDPKSDFEKCWVAHVRPIILADSSLQLCCLARNQLVPEAHIGVLPKTENPIDNLLNEKAEQVKAFHATAPKSCQFCIDKDNNISFSNIVSLLKINKDFKFSKASVYLADQVRKVISGDDQIIEIPLSEEQYEPFKQGSVVEV